MNRMELTRKYWKYYLMLEKRFIESSEYVEFHKDNFEVFSNGYALLLEAIGAELDTVFKEFCGFNMDERKTIADYAQFVLSNNSDIVNIKIDLREYDIEIQPFKDWNTQQPAQTLFWWSAFTDIKHNRYDNKTKANLENVLNILGSLYLIEMLFLKKVTSNTTELDVFDESSNLFTLKNWTTKSIPLERAFDVLADMFERDDGTTGLEFDA